MGRSRLQQRLKPMQERPGKRRGWLGTKPWACEWYTLNVLIANVRGLH